MSSRDKGKQPASPTHTEQPPQQQTQDELEIDVTPSALLEQLAAASLAYAKRDFTRAAELYSDAATVQDLLYGEMTPTNAEVLFLYARTLFKVAVENSDVLGGKGAQQALAGPAPSGQAQAQSRSRLAGLTEPIKPEKGRPGFQFAEDELEEESDEDAEEEGEGEGEEGEESDDFADAYELLDLARVLYEKVVEHVESTPDTPLPPNVAFASVLGRGSASSSSGAPVLEPEDGDLITAAPAVVARHGRTRLAEIHDCQAEILLESERFRDAIGEFESVLALRAAVGEPEESSLVAEGRYKLALAMEFAALEDVRRAQNEQQAQAQAAVPAGNGEGSSSSAAAAAAGEEKKEKEEPAVVDEALRQKAADVMDQAIASCAGRIALERAKRAALEAAGDTAALAALDREIADVSEMVAEMELRAADLRTPVDLSEQEQQEQQPGGAGLDLAAVGGLDGVVGMLRGLVGGAGGPDVSAARDISSLVKKRKREDGPVKEEEEKKTKPADGPSREVREGSPTKRPKAD